jgi:hypothetical protein
MLVLNCWIQPKCSTVDSCRLAGPRNALIAENMPGFRSIEMGLSGLNEIADVRIETIG